MQGGVTKGTSKKAVIVALGYPPKHKTSTIESDQWRYWNGRHGTFLVHFKDDKVTEVQATGSEAETGCAGQGRFLV